MFKRSEVWSVAREVVVDIRQGAAGIDGRAVGVQPEVQIVERIHGMRLVGRRRTEACSWIIDEDTLDCTAGNPSDL